MKLIVKTAGELLKYLEENLDMPKKRIKQYLTHGSIYVNNNRTTKYNYKLVPGMNITIDTDSKNKKTLPFEVLFEDDHIIVVNKPSGLLTIATEKEKERTLYHIVREYLVSKDKNARIFIIHRLDKDTSGIVVLAKDEKTKNKLQENWNEYVTLREYVAVVHGHLKNESDKIVQKLKETKTNLVYPTKDEDGKEAITNYKVIKENENYSMVSINIETGRKNQIRVAMNSINHPIVGDKKYGSTKNPIRRVCLHASRLVIKHPLKNIELTFEAKLPKEFKQFTEEK